MTHKLYKLFALKSSLNKEKSVVFIVTLASVLESVICIIFIPSIPAIAHSYNITIQEAESNFTWYNVGLFLSAPVYGVLGEFFGRRLMMIIGGLLLFLASLSTIFTFHAHEFFISRFLQGFGACAAGAVGWAAIQDIFDLKKSALIMSIMGAIIMVIPLSAPLLGGYIDSIYGWEMIKKIIIFLSFFYIASVFFIFPETKKKGKSLPNQKKFINDLIKYFLIIKNRKFMKNSLLFPLSYFCEWLFISFFTYNYYIFQNNDPKLIGIYFSILILFYVFGAFVTTYRLKRSSIYSIIKLSLNIMLFISLLRVGNDIIFNFQILSSLIFQAVFMMGSGMLFGPSSSLALKSVLNSAAAASSIRTFLLMLGGALGAWVGSIICSMPILIFSLLVLIITISMKFFYFYTEIPENF
ncbi:MAG: MFS transporter [Proteobacteria bacterium]|nr:MFS transporter [Pseudomonadota bacterium]